MGMLQRLFGSLRSGPLPQRAEAVDLNLRGVAAMREGRTAEAAVLLSQAVAADPEHPDAHYNLGNSLLALERFEEALRSYERAVALRPDDAQAWSNRGISLASLANHAAALESHTRAITLKPDFAEAYINRGVALQALNRHDAALSDFERAVALSPDDATARNNFALCCLKLGHLARGWEALEWRWKDAAFAGDKRNFPQPLWLGEQSLQGKTILLHDEQGYGDTLQFCRYAPLVARRGARVVLEVKKAILPLLAGLAGADRVIAKGEPLPEFDYHCPLLTLPLAFRTTVETIPADIPYVRADANLVRAWRERLGPKRGLRVGLAWSANRFAAYGRARSIRLAELAEILPAGAQCISLQHELSEEERAYIAGRPDIRHFGPEFPDIAALIALVDIVVSVDTSILHVAGAMGRPVWILLRFNGDWRWMADREDSPWYPTARLFRQPAPGDWSNLLGRVRDELSRVELSA